MSSESSRYVLQLQPSRWMQLRYMIKSNWKWMWKEWKRTIFLYVIIPICVLLFFKALTNRPDPIEGKVAEIPETPLLDVTQQCETSNSRCVHVGTWINKEKVSPDWQANFNEFPGVLKGYLPNVRVKEYTTLDDMKAATLGTGSEDLAIGIAAYSMFENTVNYTLVGRHTVLAQYGANLQNYFDTHLINFFRSHFLNNQLPPFNVTASPQLRRAGLPFVQRDLVSYYTLAASAFIFLISITYLYDISIQMVRDRTSGFRLILEVAGVSPVVEILSVIMANIPTTLVLTLMVVIIEYAVGDFRRTNALEVFVVLFIAFLSHIPLGVLLAVRAKNPSLVLSLILCFFSLQGIKDDVMFAFRYVTIFQYLNAGFAPGTLAWILLKINEHELLQRSGSIFAVPEVQTGILSLIIQIIAVTIIVILLHIVLPGAATERYRMFSKSMPSMDESDTAVGNDTSPVLQLRLGDNTYKGSRRGIRDVNLDIQSGQAIALLGHNGAGKSSLISLLCGVRRVRDGFIRYVCASNPSNPTEPRQTFTLAQKQSNMAGFHKILGFCPQHNALRDELSAYEHLEFIAALRGITKVERRQRNETTNVEELVPSTLKEYLEDLLESLELTAAMHRPVSSYSGGMLRKTCLAVSLVGNPALLILDEFTTGMDIVSRTLMWTLLKNLIKASSDRIILFSTHDMEEAENLGDRVAVISQGQLHEFKTPAELKSEYATGIHLYVHKVKPTILTIEKDAGEIAEQLINVRYDSQSVETELIKHLGHGIEIGKETERSITYIVPKQSLFSSDDSGTSPLSVCLQSLKENKELYGIADIDLSAESLERVFMEITTRHDQIEEKDVIISERGKVRLSDYIDFIRKKGEQEKAKESVNKMQFWSAARFAARSAFIMGGSAMYSSVFLAIIFVIFANLFTNGDQSPKNLKTTYFIGPTPGDLSKPTRGYRLLLPSDSFSKANTEAAKFQFIEKAVLGRFNDSLPDLQSVRNCVLSQPRAIAGWDVVTGVPPVCSPGFKVYSWPVNSTMLPDVTLILDNGKVPFANGDRFALMVQGMTSMILSIFTAGGMFPWGSTTDHPTYDAGYMVNILNMAKQFVKIQGDPKYDPQILPSLLLRTGYQRLWDENNTKDAIRWIIVIPLYTLSQTLVPANVMKLIHAEYLSGLGHHMMIHGFKPPLHKMTVVIRSLINSFHFFIICWVALLVGTVQEISTVVTSTKFHGSVFSAGPYVSALPVTFLLFHAVCAAAANPLLTLFRKNKLFARSPLSPPAMIKSLEFFSVITWTVIRWFAPNFSYTIAAIITVINPFWTLTEFMYTIFAVGYEGKDANLWTPAIIFGIQFLIFAFLSIYTSPYGVKADSLVTDLEKIVTEDEKQLTAETSDQEVVLQVKDLKFSYGHEKGAGVLDGVSFNIHRGECFALLGRNGAGKSTTMKCILGQHTPTSGSAYALSQSLIPFNLREIQGKLGYCPQDDKALMSGLSIIEHLQFYCVLKGIPMSQQADVIERAFEHFQLPAGQLWDPVSFLSGGTKRKLSLALALLGNPSFVVLDEPSAGVDVLARSNIWKIILEAKKDKALLITTHIMEESEFLSNRIGFLTHGKLSINEDPVILKSSLALTYEILIRFSSASKIPAILDFMRANIDPESEIKDRGEEIVEITVRIGVTPTTANLDKFSWMVAVLRGMEKARCDAEVGVEEYVLTQRSLTHLLFDHGERMDGSDIEESK